VDWKPKDDDIELTEAVLDVFDRYRTLGLLPLGPRGVGYRLEGQTIAGNTVMKGDDGLNAAERLAAHGPTFTFNDIGEIVTMCWRTRRIAPTDVDDGRTTARWPLVANDLLTYLREEVDNVDYDLLGGQEVWVEAWIEAAGGLGVWSTIAHRWGVPVLSGSGSVPAQAGRAAAHRWTVGARRHPVVLVIIVTDCDPAGYVIADRLAAESEACVHYYGDQVKVLYVRLALSPEQVQEHGISWGKAKTSHGRTMAQTAEAEALPPEVARDLFDGLMLEVLDTDAIGRIHDAWTTQVKEAQRLLTPRTTRRRGAT
jgi:hypothetical protein